MYVLCLPLVTLAFLNCLGAKYFQDSGGARSFDTLGPYIFFDTTLYKKIIYFTFYTTFRQQAQGDVRIEGEEPCTTTL